MSLLVFMLLCFTLAGQRLPVAFPDAPLQLVPLDQIIYSFPEHAPGSRVRVEQTPGGDACLPAAEKLKLDVYPLGTLRGYPAQLITTGECRVDAVLPIDLPIGPAEAVLTGLPEKLSAYFRVVPFRMILITENGLVPGNQLTHPFTPGAAITLRTTGAGNTPASELRVRIGEVEVTVREFRRSPVALGIDELEFTIPEGFALSGCYLPLVAEALGEQSRQALLSVMPFDRPCEHPFGLSAAHMAALDRGERLVVATLNIGRIGYDVANVSFRWVDGGGLARYSLTGSPPTGGCSYTSGGVLSGVLERINAYFPRIAALTLFGPDGRQIRLPRRLPGYAFNTGEISRESPNTLAPGQWTLRGEDGPNAEKVEWNFYLPPLWQPDVRITGERTVELRWNGSDYRDGDVISIRVSNEQRSGYCSVRATEGFLRTDLPEYFELPSDLKSAFEGTVYRPGRPIAQPFTPIGGLGLGLVSYELRN